jgi:hypothetical protein
LAPCTVCVLQRGHTHTDTHLRVQGGGGHQDPGQVWPGRHVQQRAVGEDGGGGAQQAPQAATRGPTGAGGHTQHQAQPSGHAVVERLAQTHPRVVRELKPGGGAAAAAATSAPAFVAGRA